jgi:peptidoglycan/LPS O-acetylase OafA/YrhL
MEKAVKTNHNTYYPNLNSLRAFAAITVILYHIIELLPWSNFPRTVPLMWFRYGWLGVDLFFILSGFVIALSAFSLVEQHPPALARRIFMRRRLVRIAPLYVLTCILFVLLVQPQLINQDGLFV